MRLHKTFVLEYPAENYVDYPTEDDAMKVYDIIVLGENEYKYLFAAYDGKDDDGDVVFYPEFDYGLAYEGTGEYA